ncbi:hypothetical protein F5X98DRAFT_297597 [Xylaria grammica]|nr:hypothetical protein F5X98DRAFT_297597 [Xylaria grammica]
MGTRGVGENKNFKSVSQSVSQSVNPSPTPPVQSVLPPLSDSTRLYRFCLFGLFFANASVLYTLYLPTAPLGYSDLRGCGLHGTVILFVCFFSRPLVWFPWGSFLGSRARGYILRGEKNTLPYLTYLSMSGNGRGKEHYLG